MVEKRMSFSGQKQNISDAEMSFKSTKNYMKNQIGVNHSKSKFKIGQNKIE